MNIPKDILINVLDFLPEEDLTKFPSLLAIHTRLRTAIETIHSPRDLFHSRRFPNSKLSLYINNPTIYSFLKPQEIPKIVRLYTSINFPTSFQNLTYLNISHSTVVNLPSLPYIKELNCAYTLVEEIPDSYTSLISLDISHSSIGKLSNSFINLETLNAYNSLLTELSPLYTNLKELDVGQTIIRELPHTFTKLKKLECRFSEILLIPPTYTKLERLDCSYTKADIPQSIRMLPMKFFRDKSIYQINFFLRKK